MTARTPVFVYLLAWPDEAAKEAAGARFTEDDEWKAVKRATAEAHGTLVGEIEGRLLVPHRVLAAAARSRGMVPPAWWPDCASAVPWSRRIRCTRFSTPGRCVASKPCSIRAQVLREMPVASTALARPCSAWAY